MHALDPFMALPNSISVNAKSVIITNEHLSWRNLFSISSMCNFIRPHSNEIRWWLFVNAAILTYVCIYLAETPPRHGGIHWVQWSTMIRLMNHNWKFNCTGGVLLWISFELEKQRVNINQRVSLPPNSVVISSQIQFEFQTTSASINGWIWWSIQCCAA